MSSRPFIVHQVANVQPAGQQLGDEWFNPATNQLSKTLVVNGNTVISTEILTNRSPNFTTVGTITAVGFIETSSAELKQNIRPIENVMPNVMQLEPVIYDRKDGSRFDEPGLIAEQVETVFPELVSRDETGRATGIYYTKLTVYLLEAIQTLQKQVEELKKGPSA